MYVLLLVIDWLANSFQNSCSNGPHISGKHHRVSILDQSFSFNCLTSDYSLLHQSRLCIFVCFVNLSIVTMPSVYKHILSGCMYSMTMVVLRKIEFVL